MLHMVMVVTLHTALPIRSYGPPRGMHMCPTQFYMHYYYMLGYFLCGVMYTILT
jgi:hypothetical protein